MKVLTTLQCDLPDGKYLIRGLNPRCGWFEFRDSVEGKIMVKRGRNFFFEDGTDILDTNEDGGAIGNYFHLPSVEPVKSA